MTRTNALITPSVIQWARERAGYSLANAAEKFKISEEDLQAWEAGTKSPSIPQARKASEIYKRSLAVFFLPEPPKDFKTLRDFRTLPEGYPSEYSPELSFLIRNMHVRQEWMREYLINEGTEPLSFLSKISKPITLKNLTDAILNTLDISPNEQINCKTRTEALKLWIDKVEAVGIYIIREKKIDPKEARGLILCDDYAPFIFLNGEDAVAAQLFTLAHELAHLWINQSGLSNLEPIGRVKNEKISKIETFCNKVASSLILANSSFNHKLSTLDSNLSTEEKIESLSKIFQVSEETIARRFLEKNLISDMEYLTLRRKYQERWIEFKKNERQKMKDKKRGPSYYVKKYYNGYAFTHTVVDAYFSGTITARDASGLLDIKVNNIKKLADVAGIVFL
ncbi:MAG: XRE family transcriptional regulator [Candidatus Auribacterota bacterium]|nr:XRE family transcriptional regulator [Candidatus Auribacterota bacterium]